MKRVTCLLCGVIFIFLGITQLTPVQADIGEPFMSQSASQLKVGQGTLNVIPLSAREAVSATLGKNEKAYHIFDAGNGIEAKNNAQGLSMNFKRGSVFFRTGGSRWGLRLSGIGRDLYAALPEATPTWNANRLEYDHGPVREWYINGPLGLEQGFTVARRPGGKSDIPFGLELSMFGDLMARIDQDRQGISLTRMDGSKVLRYCGLRAYDASGMELLTWLEVRGSRLWLKVRDDGAAYPVTIDPLVQQQKLTAADGAADDAFGFSVSLSADGNTALVGAVEKNVGGNSYQGAAYVFVRSGTTWSQQQKLTAADGVANDQFGCSVSLSANGNTALIGTWGKDVGANLSQGAAYVFTRSGGVWSQQSVLTANGGAAGDQFGRSVSLSADGNTALIGAYSKTVGGNLYQGAAYIFDRSGSVWSQQPALTAADGFEGEWFGYAVSLSADGNTALIGAHHQDNGANVNQGSAYVYTRFSTVWFQQQKLTASDGAAENNFGCSVSLNDDGNTALIGANGKNSNQGAAYVFDRSGGVWSQQQELTAADGAAFDQFGHSVSLSADGNSALIGVHHKTIVTNSSQGAAYVFTRSGGAWSQQQKLTATDGAAFDWFGYYISLSADGNTALIGAPYKTIGANAQQGAAYVFYDVPAPCTYTLSRLSESFASSGAQSNVTVMPSDNGCAWTATSNNAWITITAGSSGTGTGTVSYSVAANPAQATRTGTMTIAGQTFTVTQSGTCTYTLSHNADSFDFSSATSNLTVIPSDNSCSWTATSNDPWIAISAGSAGTGTGAVSYNVEANPAQATRTGTMTVAGVTFTVTQSGTCNYILTPGTASFSGASATDSVTVTPSDNSCAWTAISNDAWITVTAGSAGTGAGTVSYAVDANPSDLGRSGSIIIAGQTFDITQASFCTYALSSTIATFSSPSGTGSITVTTSGGNCPWTAVSNDTWITVTAGAWGMDQGIVSYGLTANTTTSNRIGTITVGGQVFTIIQNGAVTTFDTVQKIYIGYYQRPADPAGLIWWANRLAMTGGILTNIIEAFANSDESQALYGTIDSSNIAGVINAIYQALFNRDADAAGRDYYVAGFNAGTFTAATIMLNILDGAQNYDLLTLTNKLTASNVFTKTIDPELDGATFQATYEGDADAVAARYFLSLVTSLTSSIPTQSQVTEFIKSFIADAGDPVLLP